MTRAFLISLVLLLGAAATGVAQLVQPRSADYLFSNAVDDVRSLWLNPAGLGVVVETSIMADFVLELPEGASARLSQWTVGFNARGISVGYQRDRLVSDSANHALRLGLSRGFPGGALGVSVTNYSSGTTDQGWDVGVRYAPLTPVQLALVLRHIGRPFVRGEVTPLTTVAGAGWTAGGGALQLMAEALVSERIDDSGYDTSYRAGARVRIDLPIPLAGLVATDLDDDLSVSRWTFGLAVGGDRSGAVVATLPSGTASNDVWSLHGLATNRGFRLARR